MLSSPLYNYLTMTGGKKSALNLLTSANLFAGAFFSNVVCVDCNQIHSVHPHINPHEEKGQLLLDLQRTCKL